MAKHLKVARSKNGEEEKHNSSLALKKEDSMAVEDEVENSQKAGEVGSESNVIIEELAASTPPSVNLEPDEMCHEELQAGEGN